MNGQQLSDLVQSINPAMLICSGWIDKDYTKICSGFRKKIPVILLLDNHWKGTLKQRIATLISPFTIRKRFTHCWVPGEPQYRFALRLGFKTNMIRTGFYCADTTLFRQFYHQYLNEKSVNYPKRILYVGRYVEFKGIKELWRTFASLRSEFPQWELWCAGTGDLWEERDTSEGIRHFGFVQPSELGQMIRDCGVFILPSHQEPWGVVVHEMAAAGMPLLCSNAVGSASAFVQQDVNGWLFQSNDDESLKQQLRAVMNLKSERLLEMSEKSHQLSLTISPGTWVNTLLGFMS